MLILNKILILMNYLNKSKNMFFTKKPFHVLKIHFDECISTLDIYKFMSSILDNKVFGSAYAVYKHSCMGAIEISSNIASKHIFLNRECKSLLPQNIISSIIDSLTNKRVFLEHGFIKNSIVEHKINILIKEFIFPYGRYSSSAINEEYTNFAEELKQNTFDYEKDTLNTQCIVIYSENPIIDLSFYKQRNLYLIKKEILSKLNLDHKFNNLVTDACICEPISNKIFESINNDSISRLNNGYHLNLGDITFLHACFIEYFSGISVVLEQEM